MTVKRLKRPTALFDLDGTLADYSGALLDRFLRIMAPEELPLAPTEMGRDDGWPAYWKARKRLVAGTPGFWRNLAPIPLGMGLLALAKEMDFKVHILTRGPVWHPDAWAEKVGWVAEHVNPLLGYRAPITITSGEKANVYGRLLVDDWPDYVEPWLAKRPRGRVILPAQPWNEYALQEHPRVLRLVDNDLGWLAARAVFSAADPRQSQEAA